MRNSEQYLLRRNAAKRRLPASNPDSGQSRRFLIFLRYAFFAFIFSVPFDVVDMSYLSGGGFTLSKILGYGLVFSTLLQPDLCYARYPRSLPYFSAYFFTFVALGIAQSPSISSILYPSITLIQMIALFWISFSFMLSDRVITQSLWCLVASTTILALLLAVGIASDTLDQERASFAGENPNIVAAVLSLGLIALAGLAFGRSKPNLLTRLCFIVCPVILIIQIVRTGSRGAVIALSLGLLAFLLRRGQKLGSKLKIMALLTILLSILVVVSLQFEAVRVRWVKTLTYGDTAGRDTILPRAWDMFLESPFLGWGPVSHLIELGRRTGFRIRDPHNLYLWIMNEVGLCGAILFFLGLLHCCRAAWKARRGTQGVLPLAILLFVLILNLKGTYHNQKFFWIILAYVSASGAYPNVPARTRSLLERSGRYRFVPEDGLSALSARRTLRPAARPSFPKKARRG